MKLRLLHLEDNGDDVELVRMTLARDGVDCDILAVSSAAAYLAALKQPHFDAVLSDSAIPGYDGGEALSAARNRFPEIPFIVVSGSPGVTRPQAATGENPTARVAKSELHRLGPELRLAVSRPQASPDVVANLERQVAELTAEVGRRNTELEVLNNELESFSYSVAHDLRSPLITIDGFTQVVLENTAGSLDEINRDHLQRVATATRRMHRLINDLLDLSKLVRTPLHRGTVDLSKLAREILQTLRDGAPSRVADLLVTEGLSVSGDSGLLRIALENLLGNAWKFTSRKDRTHIEFGSGPDRAGRTVYFVRDNGAGFDPRYATKLFSPFQRLHSETQFSGTGMGLATVQRIIHRHGGEIWAESAVDCGAGFYFTLAL
ncbi:MAG TPA: ATP-binding protein [Steroidobacteraceae bacterium]|nr:ATP-binding protein [Steroidobacteraceae bacterium]